MSFFDGVGKKISQTGQGAALKAKNVAETVKLNGMISDEERRISILYQQIGKVYYEAFRENPDQRLEGLVSEINNSISKIAAYGEQVKQLKGVVHCQKCGAEVSFNSAFCNSCGSPMKPAQAAPPSMPGMPDVFVCSLCGCQLAPDNAFCTNCGNKMDSPAVSAPAQDAGPLEEGPQSTAFAEPEQPVCSECGKVLADGAMFCVYCGKKIGD